MGLLPLSTGALEPLDGRDGVGDTEGIEGTERGAGELADGALSFASFRARERRCKADKTGVGESSRSVRGVSVRPAVRGDLFDRRRRC